MEMNVETSNNQYKFLAIKFKIYMITNMYNHSLMNNFASTEEVICFKLERIKFTKLVCFSSSFILDLGYHEINHPDLSCSFN